MISRLTLLSMLIYGETGETRGSHTLPIGHGLGNLRIHQYPHPRQCCKLQGHKCRIQSVFRAPLVGPHRLSNCHNTQANFILYFVLMTQIDTVYHTVSRSRRFESSLLSHVRTCIRIRTTQQSSVVIRTPIRWQRTNGNTITVASDFCFCFWSNHMAGFGVNVHEVLSVQCSVRGQCATSIQYNGRYWSEGR